jgi:hypothetical protein
VPASFLMTKNLPVQQGFGTRLCFPFVSSIVLNPTLMHYLVSSQDGELNSSVRMQVSILFIFINDINI